MSSGNWFGVSRSTYLRDIVGPVVENHDIELPISEHVPEQRPREVRTSFLLLGATFLERHASFEVLLFLLAQPALGTVGRVRQQEGDSDAEKDGDDALSSSMSAWLITLSATVLGWQYGGSIPP